jgi:ABC-2 type transport system permease protein
VIKLLSLLQNENMKLYRRLRTWILLGLLIVLVVGISSIIKFNQPPRPTDWKQQVTQQTEGLKKMVNGKGISTERINNYERQIKINDYRLQHDIAPPDGNVWSNVLTLSNVIMVVTIFTVIVAADSVASEFSGGTVKLLLIRPASRTKVLLSKYLAVLQYSLFMLLVLFAISYLVSGIFFGFGGSGSPYLTVSGGVVKESSMLLHALAMYGLASVSLLMVVTVAFMISTVFRSSSLAIGISLGVLFISDTLVRALQNYSWIKYYLFANTNLSSYLDGNPLRDDMTMGFSIVVLAVYFVLLNLLSWSIFTKRDVAA